MPVFRTILRCGALVLTVSGLSACAQGGGLNLPLPGASPAPQVNAPRAPGPNDAVLSGSAFLANGAYAQIPAGSRMTVRVYDSTRDVNDYVAERVFTNAPAALPWSYEMFAPNGAIAAMARPAVAARIEAPDGRLLYVNETVAPLVAGQRDDIALVASGVGTARPPVYGTQQAPVYTAPTAQPPVYQSSGEYDLVPVPLPEPTAEDLIGADPIYQPSPTVYESAPVYGAPSSTVYESAPVYLDPTPQPPVYQSPQPTYDAPVVQPSRI